MVHVSVPVHQVETCQKRMNLHHVHAHLVIGKYGQCQGHRDDGDFVVDFVKMQLHCKTIQISTSFSGGGRVKKPTDFERKLTKKHNQFISQDEMHELSDITTERFSDLFRVWKREEKTNDDKNET